MEKKTDINSLIGLLLLGLIFFWFISQNQKKIEKEAPSSEETSSGNADAKNTPTPLDSLKQDYALISPNKKHDINKEGESLLENENLLLKVSNRGGWFSEVFLKKFKPYINYKENKDGMVYMVKNQNADFSLQLITSDNKIINTKDEYFIPKFSKAKEGQRLSMRLDIEQGKYIEYVYFLKPGEYMIDFSIQSKGLNGFLNSAQDVQLQWNVQSFFREKSRRLEERNNEFYYTYQDNRVSYDANDDGLVEQNLGWIASRQNFFTSTLITNSKFKTAEMAISPIQDDSIYIKKFQTKAPLSLTGGELDYSMNWYYGPVDYDILKEYGLKLEKQVQFGWTIFRAVNLYFINKIFKLLRSWGLGYGLIIFMMTIVIKIVLSPVTYKQYLQSAKMRVLKPQIDALNKKNQNTDPLKRQQETMKLYRKVGVNPMAGCLPAILQMPILYAMFRFFPSLIELRQKRFLWADDLSSYDSILEMSFNIPFYGSHISLFTILMALSLFFYTQMSGTQMPQSRQQGMPDMKFMFYIMPFMMLFFFNEYASGLSYYYFIANFTTIILVLIIKKFVINEEKILKQMEEYKAKPKKRSKFGKRLDNIMKQAQERQKQNQRNTKKRK